MSSHCRNSLPVTVRRKSGAPLAAYSTIPQGGHNIDTDRQPCRANAPISGARGRGQHAMVPIDSEYDIQSDTPGTIPRGVLSQCGGDLSDTHREFHRYRRMAEVSSVCTRTRVMHPLVILFPGTPPRVIASLPQMKLRLSEADVNGRFDRRDDLRFSKGDTEHTEQRSDHGAVTLWLHALS